ncbi:MAG: hypothetical protein ACOX2F_08785 [bacterium]
MTKLSKGSISVTVFNTSKTPDNIEEIRKMLAKYPFVKLEPTDVRDESSGWVDATLSFDSEHFSSLMHDRFLLFALRSDKYSFSASQMRPDLEEAEFLYRQNSGVTHIAAQQKKEIKEQIIRKMKMNSLPKVTVVEAAWDMETGKVYFFSQSNHMVTLFSDIFEKTFEVTLQTVSLLDSVDKILSRDKVEPVFGKIWGSK